MLSANPFSSRFITTAIVAAAIAAFGLSARAEDKGSQQTPYIDDWSHHHLVFSNPGTREDAIKNGKLGDWQRVNSDVRYKIQDGKRSHGNRPVVNDSDSEEGHGRGHDRGHDHDGNRGHHKDGGSGQTGSGIEKDWNTPIGSGFANQILTIGTPSSSTISGTSTITVGGVTFTASAPTAASRTGTFSGVPTSGQTATITNGGNALVLTAGNTVNTGTITLGSNAQAADTVTVGSIVYTFVNSLSSPNQVLISNQAGRSTQNLYAAINGDVSLCFTANCISGTTVANPSASATVAGSQITVTNTTTSAIALSTVSGGRITVSAATIGASTTQNGCTSTTAGTFIAGTTATQAAVDLAAAINSCNSAFPAVGVTSSSLGAVTTVDAATAGTPGNAITLAKTITALTWSGSPLTGGTNGTASGTTFPYWTGTTYVTASVLATNIATAITTNGTTGVTPTANSPVSGDLLLKATAAGTAGNAISSSNSNFSAVTGTGSFAGGATSRVQPNASPAKYGASLTAASCANDFVVYPTGQPGSDAGASIIAYNNMYTTGCSGTVPQAFWAYNTGAGSSVTTSPIISLDGTKVAFVQSDGTTASLVVVKWLANSADSITNPETLGTSTNINACTAPCMTVTNLTNDDTLSAPYYDPNNDVLFVGDDSGTLEKFTGVFFGTAVTKTTLALGNTNPLSSPVFDSISGCVFVGDTRGFLYKANSGLAGGSICTSGSFTVNATSADLGSAANGGYFDGVLLDSTAGTLYGFLTSSITQTHVGICAVNSNCIVEFPTSFGAAATPSFVQPLGTGAAGRSLYAGTFDNVYFSLGTGIGNIFAVGGTAANVAATLQRVPVATGGVLGTPTTAVAGLTTANAAYSAWPSPVTEFCNNGASSCTVLGGVTNSGTDFVFFSLYHSAVGGAPCTNASGNGCIVSYNISNPAAVAISGTGQNFTAPANPGCWATGAIVLDNSVPTGTLAGASQIYFVNLNGATAGGPNGAVSASCQAGSTVTLSAVQAAQNNP